MKTKWGACNIEARRIWLNLELAKKPVQCLEYLIVHELVHLIERHHNDGSSPCGPASAQLADAPAGVERRTACSQHLELLIYKRRPSRWPRSDTHKCARCLIRIDGAPRFKSQERNVTGRFVG